jgi:hypothetical protein
MSEEQAKPAQAPASTPAAEDGQPAGPSKSELKKRAKEAEKAQKAAERAAREEEEKRKREEKAAQDSASQNYGKLPLHQSQERNGMSSNTANTPSSPRANLDAGQKRIKFTEISKDIVGQPVIFRARLHNVRPQGKLSSSSILSTEMSLINFQGAKIVFLTLRQQTHTLQGVLVVSGEQDEHQVSKQMLKFAQTIPVS